MAPISPCVRTYTQRGYPSLCIINSQFQQKVSLHGNFHSVITGLMNFFSHFSDQFNYSYQLMECFNTAVDCICSKPNTNAHPCQITRHSQYKPIKCYSSHSKQMDKPPFQYLKYLNWHGLWLWSLLNGLLCSLIIVCCTVLVIW